MRQSRCPQLAHSQHQACRAARPGGERRQAIGGQTEGATTDNSVPVSTAGDYPLSRGLARMA